MLKKIINGLFFISFIFYVSFLLWNILFKYIAPWEVFSSNREMFRGVNFIPFNDILNGNYNELDVFGNVVLFIPLGIYIPIFFKKISIYKNIGIVALIALLFEVSQYIFSLGASDVTDIITNTVGGVLGLLVYLVIKKIFKDDIKVKNFVAICSTMVMVPVAFLLFVLFSYN